MNRNRILGRLASRHFRRPEYENGPARPPLSQRFKAYVRSSNRPSAETKELHRQIDAFHDAFLDVENLAADTETIKRVVGEAFRLTVDGISLPDRLERAGFSASRMDTRDIREINKVANYWRICHSLAHLSRAYRPLFSKMNLATIEPFAPSVRQGSSKRRHVHAEIQIIIYYERVVPPNNSRIIGASKEACFLCDSFIKAHGLFCVSRAHRQIFSQWTIPDLAEYNTEALERLQRALATVHRDVATALNQARDNHKFRRHPLQSAINLHRLHIPTPSVTTIRSTPLEGTSIGSERASSSLQLLSPVFPESESTLNQLRMSHHSSAIAVSTSNSTGDLVDHASKKEVPDSSEDASVRVDSIFPQRALPGWLDLYVSLTRNSIKPAPTEIFSRVSVDQEYLPDRIIPREKTHHHLDLNTLAVGEEIILPNPIGPDTDVRAGTEMRVIHIPAHETDHVEVLVAWHNQWRCSNDARILSYVTGSPTCCAKRLRCLKFENSRRNPLLFPLSS